MSDNKQSLYTFLHTEETVPECRVSSCEGSESLSTPDGGRWPDSVQDSGRGIYLKVETDDFSKQTHRVSK